jgi:hypothetical protein
VLRLLTRKATGEDRQMNADVIARQHLDAFDDTVLELAGAIGARGNGLRLRPATVPFVLTFHPLFLEHVANMTTFFSMPRELRDATYWQMDKPTLANFARSARQPAYEATPVLEQKFSEDKARYDVKHDSYLQTVRDLFDHSDGISEQSETFEDTHRRRDEAVQRGDRDTALLIGVHSL